MAKLMPLTLLLSRTLLWGNRTGNSSCVRCKNNTTRIHPIVRKRRMEVQGSTLIFAPLSFHCIHSSLHLQEWRGKTSNGWHPGRNGVRHLAPFFVLPRIRMPVQNVRADDINSLNDIRKMKNVAIENDYVRKTRRRGEVLG